MNEKLTRFHKISPCPKCGGKVKAKWVVVDTWNDDLIFKCGSCGLSARMDCLSVRGVMGRIARSVFGSIADLSLKNAIRRWNAMCNGDKRYRLIYERIRGTR